MDLREMQTRLPWTIRYSRDYRASPQTHKDFAHGVTHALKALGRLAALVDDMDHDREVADDATLRARHAKYIADLVVCALRMANTFPGGGVDLDAEVRKRIVDKNDVDPRDWFPSLDEQYPLYVVEADAGGAAPSATEFEIIWDAMINERLDAAEDKEKQPPKEDRPFYQDDPKRLWGKRFGMPAEGCPCLGCEDYRAKYPEEEGKR